MNLMTVPSFNAPHNYQYDTGDNGCNGKSFDTEILYDTVYNDDKCSLSIPRSAHCCLPRKRDNEPTDNSGDQSFSGLTPEAIPNAMASGRATMPTMIPAIRSAMNFSLE